MLKELAACSTLCNINYHTFLAAEGLDETARCIALCRECADICLLTASLISRNSENAERFIAVCADICEMCADECAKHNYAQSMKCAQVCRKCVEMCDEYQAHQIRQTHAVLF